MHQRNQISFLHDITSKIERNHRLAQHNRENVVMKKLVRNPINCHEFFLEEKSTEFQINGMATLHSYSCDN